MTYIPERGDIISLDTIPKAQKGKATRQHALVLTSSEYNAKVSLCVVCPITNLEKGYPFEVRLPDKLPLHGVILTDHLKSLDWKTRKAEFVGKISLETIEAVLDKVGDLLEM